ncbi:hypothetical protein NVP1286O_04 [Vibrio phage 1.286.O._10N.286.55.C4]|nr:hypothetical protein NVP1286O_04 [Vibrio phage 1.286.O._10N.286.55.C4]
MKHKHYDMIVAKAANMELVVFYKLPCEEWWQLDSECEALPGEVEIDYFLCLPRHKEACLHWLNGGDVERLTAHQGFLKVGYGLAWSACHEFMNEELKFRVKPKKEKRLIVYRNDVVYGPYLLFDDINPDFVATGQVIEIEVEV